MAIRPVIRKIINLALGVGVLFVCTLVVQVATLCGVMDDVTSAAKADWASRSPAHAAFLDRFKATCARAHAAMSKRPPGEWTFVTEKSCLDATLAQGQAEQAGLSREEAGTLLPAVEKAISVVTLPAPLRWVDSL